MFPAQQNNIVVYAVLFLSWLFCPYSLREIGQLQMSRCRLIRVLHVRAVGCVWLRGQTVVIALYLESARLISLFVSQVSLKWTPDSVMKSFLLAVIHHQQHFSICLLSGDILSLVNLGMWGQCFHNADFDISLEIDCLGVPLDIDTWPRKEHISISRNTMSQWQCYYARDTSVKVSQWQWHYARDTSVKMSQWRCHYSQAT